MLLVYLIPYLHTKIFYICEYIFYAWMHESMEKDINPWVLRVT